MMGRCLSEVSVLLDGSLMELPEENWGEGVDDREKNEQRRTRPREKRFVCIHLQQADGTAYPTLPNSLRMFDLWYDKDVLRSSQGPMPIKCKKLQVSWRKRRRRRRRKKTRNGDG
eukprot:768087-Hanusia_phi.AAC.9